MILMLRFFFCASLIAFLWIVGLLWYVAAMPNTPAPDDAHAEAIVVLTGGKGRLEEGFRRLASDAAPIMFVSGAGDDVRTGDLIRPLPPELQKKVRALGAPAIVLGYRARNTIGNAEETQSWLNQNPKKSILLVTSHYHMPRALSEFYSVMPDLHIIAAPVIADDFPESWWQDKNSRDLALSEYHKFIASKLRHFFVFVAQPQ